MHPRSTFALPHGDILPARANAHTTWSVAPSPKRLLLCSIPLFPATAPHRVSQWRSTVKFVFLVGASLHRIRLLAGPDSSTMRSTRTDVLSVQTSLLYFTTLRGFSSAPKLYLGATRLGTVACNDGSVGFTMWRRETRGGNLHCFFVLVCIFDRRSDSADRNICSLLTQVCEYFACRRAVVRRLHLRCVSCRRPARISTRRGRTSRERCLRLDIFLEPLGTAKYSWFFVGTVSRTHAPPW